MDRSSAQGAFVKAPKAPRGVGAGGLSLSPRRKGLGRGLDPSPERGLDPSPENVLLLELKMEHFGSLFKLDLTEEKRTQL